MAKGKEGINYLFWRKNTWFQKDENWYRIKINKFRGRWAPGLSRHWEGNLEECLSSSVLHRACRLVSLRLPRWTDAHAPNLGSCYLHEFACNQSFDVKKLIRAAIIFNIDIDIISSIIRVGRKEICSENFIVDNEGGLGKGFSVLWVTSERTFALPFLCGPWGTHVYLWWIHFDIWQN